MEGGSWGTHDSQAAMWWSMSTISTVGYGDMASGLHYGLEGDGRCNEHHTVDYI